MTLDDWGDWAYIYLATGLLMMAFSFLFTTKWWANSVGRSIAAFFGSVGLIMLWGILRLLGVIPGDETLTMWARLVLFGMLGTAVWSMFIGFVVVQYRSRRKRRRLAAKDPAG